MAESKTLCLYPFTHVNFKIDGKVAPCFRSAAISNLNDQDFGWNGEAWKQLRKDAVSSVKSDICSSCWKLEDGGVFSYRQNSLYNAPPFVGWRDSTKFSDDSGVMSQGPKQIELRLSNECNFQCRMCGPLYSSKWQRFLAQNEDAKNSLEQVGVKYSRRPLENIADKNSDYFKKIIQALRQWRDSIEYVMIAGGEPLMQKQHLVVLQEMENYASNITLEYSTNLSTLTCEGVDLVQVWKKFKGLVLKISIDGDPEIYPYVRKHGQVQKLLQNILRLQQEIPEKIVILSGTLTVSAYNVSRIIECAEFFTKNGLLFHCSQVQQPEVLASQVLPSAIKQVITQKCENFIDKMDTVLPTWMGDHIFWQDQERRIFQKDRLVKHIRSTINFMNASDQAHRFSDFLAYDKALGAEKGQTLLSIYPEWEHYV